VDAVAHLPSGLGQRLVDSGPVPRRLATDCREFTLNVHQVHGLAGTIGQFVEGRPRLPGHARAGPMSANTDGALMVWPQTVPPGICDLLLSS
jgi:hypothetical protein